MRRLLARLRWWRSQNHADYKKIWNYYARDNAKDWIFTGADDAVFEETGKGDAGRLLPLLTADARVLNIGCGMGRVERYLAPHVAQLWGIDISGEMIQLAASRLAPFPNVRLREVAPAEYLSHFADESFDLVFSLLVLQHMEKEDAFLYLRDAYRVLKPNGILYVQFPNFLSPEYTAAFLEPAERRHRSASRVRPYTAEEARHLLEIIGFSVDRLTIESGREGNAEIYVTGKRLLTGVRAP